MELRTWACEVKGCGKVEREASFNVGFPEWGMVLGLTNPETGEDKAHVCPKCLIKIKTVLNGGTD